MMYEPDFASSLVIGGCLFTAIVIGVCCVLGWPMVPLILGSMVAGFGLSGLAIYWIQKLIYKWKGGA